MSACEEAKHHTHTTEQPIPPSPNPPYKHNTPISPPPHLSASTNANTNPITNRPPDLLARLPDLLQHRVERHGVRVHVCGLRGQVDGVGRQA